MRTQLNDILEFYALTEGELEPGRGGSGTTSTEPTLGVRIAALDFLAGNDVIGTLAEWEKAWREDRRLSDAPITTKPSTTLSSVIRFLNTWLSLVSESDPAMDEFARELNECWGIARGAARIGSKPRAWTIDCPADLSNEDTDTPTDEGICSNELRITGNDLDLKRRIPCKQCGTSWTVDRLLLVAADTNRSHIWLDAEALCARLGVSRRTLNRWVASGEVAKQHGLYDARPIINVTRNKGA